MSATTLEVGRLHARYRIARGDEQTRARLDRLLSAVAGEGLEAALVRLGFSPDEEICIRSVRAPVRLRLAMSDDALCADWSSALVAAIEAAAADGDRDVVRYPSRTHAVNDLVVSVARADYERAWAWRRLGFWRIGDEPSREAAAEAVVEALCSDGARIVPALVATSRARALAQLLALLAERQWTQLAATALRAAGAAPDLTQVSLALTGGPTELDNTDASDRLATASALVSPPPEGRFVDLAAKVLRRSAIAKAAVESRAEQLRVPAIASSVAVLALLEDDPAAVAGSAPRARAVVARVAASLRDTPSAAAEPPAEAGAPDQSEVGTLPAAPGSVHRPTSNGSSSGDPANVFDPAGGEETTSEETQAEAARRFSTRFGGLLFLLRLVAELDVPGRPPEPLAERRFRWVLHQLALALQPLEADDPAALAFAGLPPDAELPTKGEEPPSEEERLAVERIRDAIVELLRDELGELHRPPDELVDFVCRRRAEVLGDPGWIEFRFALDDVSIELRRAGLDLDLGYVPWLGTVVRFVYV